MRAKAVVLTLAACLTALSLTAWSGSALCQDSESALGNPLPPPVQDPSLKNSPTFAPSLGTSGTADIDPALDRTAKVSRGADCSSTNPCAVPPPARDRVVISAGNS
jgi:hypothetical protein